MKFNLEKYILEKVDSGEWKPNHKLPTEVELIDYTGLSKMSVRKVIERLREREILYASQGRGVFVSPFARNAKIQKLTDIFKATKVTYLPSSSKIPEPLLKRFNSDYKVDENKLITFVKLYFVGEEIVAYTLNWLFNEDGKYSKHQVVNGEGRIFEDGDFTKVVSTHKLEETSSSDKNILLTSFEYIPTTYSYYLRKDREMIMMRVCKTKPKYYTSFEVKNRY